MKVHAQIRPRGSAPRFFKRAASFAAVLGAIIIVAGPVTHRAQASGWDKMTTLTVNEPIQISDTYLDPGTYVFRLADIGSSRHVVQIFNSDQTHIINTVMAIPNYRLEPTGDSRFAFWETPPGNVKAMRAWFYPGDNFGQEFRYPAHLRQIAAVTQPPVLIQQPQQQAETTPAPVAQAPATVPETSSVEPAPATNNEPVEIAQATPPPAPAAPEQVAPAQPAQPTELPKTASPYTTIGLGGLTLLGLFGLLRVKRVA